VPVPLPERLERRRSARCRGAASGRTLGLAAGRSGKAGGSPTGTSVSGPVGEASTDTLPLYSKYIYNFGITRVLDVQPRGIKPTEKPVIFIC